ncbi:alpha/beta fold hydrolase [Paenibacillus crassostreae]|uniref:AB hydrolase-1 domain-containing protein n=1 Tax=Paenibacillus crassostreae TaxID=1763538 RepID=A0A162KVX3_9BACL|nr:alpha/beta hydrolase [Paenibacillus crassostreae]AOZ91034.1 hypothetical protein LPB68_01665 [Paenibacillus crassostreae]OAB74803.1 hypothetical protein PNBC_12290 [Paenibacillus crassostreae]
MEQSNSIFRAKADRDKFTRAYDETMKLWTVPFEDLMISTCFGDTHIVASGSIEAPAIMLFHGMTFSATMWYPNIESLTRHFRVYAVDTIGDLGKSKNTSPLKTRDEAALWISDVLHGLHLQSAIFMGHSMGGWLSLNFALRYPEKVEKLILLAPASGIYRITPKFMFKVYPAIVFPTESRLRKELSWFMSRTYEPDDQAEQLIHQFIISGMNCVPQIRVMPSVFKDHELQSLSMKILLMVGDQEVIYNYRKMLSKALRLIPNIQSHVVPNAGHALSLENHEYVNDTIIKFLI